MVGIQSRLAGSSGNTVLSCGYRVVHCFHGSCGVGTTLMAPSEYECYTACVVVGCVSCQRAEYKLCLRTGNSASEGHRRIDGATASGL